MNPANLPAGNQLAELRQSIMFLEKMLQLEAEFQAEITNLILQQEGSSDELKANKTISEMMGYQEESLQRVAEGKQRLVELLLLLDVEQQVQDAMTAARK